MSLTHCSHCGVARGGIDSLFCMDWNCPDNRDVPKVPIMMTKSLQSPKTYPLRSPVEYQGQKGEVRGIAHCEPPRYDLRLDNGRIINNLGAEEFAICLENAR